MLVFVPCAKKIESQLGTVVFVGTVLMFSVLQGVGLFLYYAVLTARNPDSEQVYQVCIAGLPSVILSLAVAHAYKFATSEAIRLPFGATLPYPVYPWLLFIVLCFTPDTTLAANIVGLLLGLAFIQGWLTPCFPNKSFALRLEMQQLRNFVNDNGFVPTEPLLPTSAPASPTTSAPADTA